MTPIPPQPVVVESATHTPLRIESETQQLYMHLLNLKRIDGEPATDRDMLHREIAKSPECKSVHLDSTILARYSSGDQILSADQVGALRDVLDRAHRDVVDPKFNWKPRWLNAQQNSRNAHASIVVSDEPPAASPSAHAGIIAEREHP